MAAQILLAVLKMTKAARYAMTLTIGLILIFILLVIILMSLWSGQK